MLFSVLMLVSSFGSLGYVLNEQDEIAKQLNEVQTEYAQATKTLEKVEKEKKEIQEKLVDIKRRILIHPLKEVDKAYTTRPFGVQRHPITKRETMHYGLDFGCTNKRSEILAVADGRVTGVGYGNKSGYFIAITHNFGRGDTLISKYMHLRYRPELKKGDLVNAGDVIGVMGNSGGSTAAHLHLELWALDESKLKYARVDKDELREHLKPQDDDRYHPIDPNDGGFIFVDAPSIVAQNNM